MQIIPLTQGKVARVDDVDFAWAMQWKWHAKRERLKDSDLWYAVRTQYSPRKHTVTMHRGIAERAGLPASRYYDHQDRDGLNNQRENIRPCTPTQNMANRRKFPGKTSSLKGVCWDRGWRARIRVNGKLFNLGRFTNEQSAAAAYQIAAQKHFGEFAA